MKRFGFSAAGKTIVVGALDASLHGFQAQMPPG
jgi:hypothetical protein